MSSVQYKQEEQQERPGSEPPAWVSWLLMRPDYAHWLHTPGQLLNHISLPGRVGYHDTGAVLRVRAIIHVKLCSVSIATIMYPFMAWNFPTTVT